MNIGSTSLVLLLVSVLILYGALMRHWGDQIVVSTCFVGIAFIFTLAGFYMFVGPVMVTNACTDLMEAANGLRTRLPIERMDEVNQLVMYLKDLNASQGPGYCIGGKLISAKLICSTSIAAAASLSLSLVEL